MREKVSRELAKTNYKLVNKIFIFFTLVSISGAVLIYWNALKDLRSSLYELMLHRESVLVRSGAKSINNFIGSNEKLVVYVASMPSVKSKNLKNLKEILTNGKKTDPLIGDIIFVDEKGDVLLRASGDTEKNNVAERDYFIWAKNPENKEKIYYSLYNKPKAGPLKDNDTFGILSPVWNEDKFVGVVGIVISKEAFSEEYIHTLKLTENSSSFLISKDGVIVSMDIPWLSGNNIFDFVDKNNIDNKAELVSIISNIKNGKDGKAAFSFKAPDGESLDMLLAYTQVKGIDGKEMVLGVLVPKEEALAFSGPFHKNFNRVLVFILFIVLGIIFLVILDFRIHQRNFYLKGFNDALRKGAKNG